MGAKMDETKSDVVRIRMTPELRSRCASARASGSWLGRAESDFLGYLVELGLTRYTKSILPIERGEDLEIRRAVSENWGSGGGAAELKGKTDAAG